MPKEFMYKGKSLDELKQLSLVDLAKILPSKQRRSLKRGLTDQQKKFLEKIKRSDKKPVKTHLRDLIVLPEMVGKLIQVYNGKTFLPLSITDEMIGHSLGEFIQTRQKVKHSAPGIGATKSSSAASVK
ncbi:30S ribosomal protein S19 [Candidatus Woesearchaeota archaeon]|nr:30S ribosomal protein S19 [Candidatus Woesearchaeota archaeon]